MRSNASRRARGTASRRGVVHGYATQSNTWRNSVQYRLTLWLVAAGQGELRRLVADRCAALTDATALLVASRSLTRLPRRYRPGSMTMPRSGRR
jgi:hypothetical protein